MLPDTDTQETDNTEAPDADAQEGEAQAPDAEAKGAEGEEGQEGEAPEGEAKADGEGEEGAATDGEEKPKAKPEGEKHKRAGGFQRKIDRLERALQERDALLSKLVGQTPGGGQAPKEKTAEEKAAEEFEKLVDKRIAEREAAREAARQQQEFQSRYDAVRERYPDFDEALADVAHIPVPRALNEALLTSEKGPEIMYQLAKSPAELARLSALPPLAAAREVGRLEAKLTSGAAPPKPKPGTRPPAPPSSVGGSAKSTRSLEDLPISEYKRALRSGRR